MPSFITNYLDKTVQDPSKKVDSVRTEMAAAPAFA